MTLISFTNIVVDNFYYGYRNPLKQFIYFLTHMHSGISHSWDFGTIYCSKTTKALLLERFPSLTNAIELELNKKHEILLNEEGDLQLLVTLIDSNHCPGSVMILFEGYMGRILHTGDMRFQKTHFEKSIKPYLELSNQQGFNIDQLHLDNTFCDEIFQFPSQSEALEMIYEIISKRRVTEKRVFIGIDSIGKEELLIDISKQFNSLIVVSQNKFSKILCMADHMPINIFTTQKDEGWIEVVGRSDYSRIQDQQKIDPEFDYIFICATGWSNQKYFESHQGKYFLCSDTFFLDSKIVPFSLHSNFSEMKTFVEQINPCFIYPLLDQQKNIKKKEKLMNNQLLKDLKLPLFNYQQKGFVQLQRLYSKDKDQLSREFKLLYDNKELSEHIEEKLGLKISIEDKKKINTILFEQKHSNIFQIGEKFQGQGGKLSTQLPHIDNFQMKLTNFFQKQQPVILIQDDDDDEEENFEIDLFGPSNEQENNANDNISLNNCFISTSQEKSIQPVIIMEDEQIKKKKFPAGFLQLSEEDNQDDWKQDYLYGGCVNLDSQQQQKFQGYLNNELRETKKIKPLGTQKTEFNVKQEQIIFKYQT